MFIWNPEKNMPKFPFGQIFEIAFQTLKIPSDVARKTRCMNEHVPNSLKVAFLKILNTYI